MRRQIRDTDSGQVPRLIEARNGGILMRKHFLIITCMDAGRHPRFFFRLLYDDKRSIRSVPKAVAEFLKRNKERWPITDFRVI
jgi:hypothetical protein